LTYSLNNYGVFLCVSGGVSGGVPGFFLVVFLVVFLVFCRFMGLCGGELARALELPLAIQVAVQGSIYSGNSGCYMLYAID
jgi:di/tricarboxylate transporter